MANRARKSIINVDLQDYGGKHPFSSVDQLLNWLNKEAEFWLWLTNSEIMGRSSLKQMSDHVISSLNSLRGSVSQLPASGGVDDNTQNVVQRIAAAYKNHQLLHSSTPEAQFITQLNNESGPVVGAAALATVLVPQRQHYFQLDLNRLDEFFGRTAIILFRLGVSPESATAVQKSFAELSDKYRVVFEEEMGEFRELATRLKNLEKQHTNIVNGASKIIGDQTDRMEQAIADTTSKYKKEFGAEIRGAQNMVKELQTSTKDSIEAVNKAHTDSVAALEDKYDKAFSLDKPVEYWRRKRIKHRWMSMGLFALFGAFLYVVYNALTDFQGTEFATPVFWKDPDPGSLALLAVIVGIAIALGRIPLRLAMSQLHLGNDADERVSMVSTFLALRQGGHASDIHMTIVLERLFAPANDGIVKDDPGPMTPVEAAKSLIERARGQ